jgi:hypothetical protein
VILEDNQPQIRSGIREVAPVRELVMGDAEFDFTNLEAENRSQ